MTLRDLAYRLPGGAQVLHEAPLRLTLSAAFFFAIPALCLLFPSLLESPRLLALIVVLAGGTSVLLLHLSRFPPGVAPSPEARDTAESLVKNQDSVHLPWRSLAIGTTFIGTVDSGLSATLTVKPRERFLFVLEDLRERLPNREQSVVDEIYESWVRCFEDHAPIVEAVRTACRRRPYAFRVWEEHPLIGSLFEETFEDLGFPVRRLLLSRTVRLGERKTELLASEELRWIQQEEYVLGAVPVSRQLSVPRSELQRWIPMRTLGQSPEVLGELVPPLAKPMSHEFADALGHLISRVLVAATRLKRHPKPAG